MAFDEVVFPLMMDRATSAPEFSTTIIPTGSGAEQRISNWLDARITFNAALGVRSKKDLKTLINFFRARKGRARGFLVKDLLDCDAEGDAFGIGDGVTQTFQLSRTYGDSENVDIRPIFKPVEGTIEIYKNAVLQTIPTQVGINYVNGLVTFAAPPANGTVLTWFGQFYIPCRFMDDKLPADEIYFDLVENRAAGGIPDVGMVEIRDFE
jgi:uncharacterized protein (TIGR02217 family)